jgi:enediyne biosynthesis protein E4
MPPHLFRNLGKGNFQEVANSLGRSFNAPRVGRGAAYADINNDGRLDLLLSTNGGPAYLFLNEAAGPAATNKSLRIKLVGTKSNRDAIGATVHLHSNGQIQSRQVRSGSSYLSQSEFPLTFGVAHQDEIEKIVVDWPSGKTEEYSKLKSAKSYQLTESKGITEEHP